MKARDSKALAGLAAPLSVLYFSNTLARGGAEEHILTLLRGLDRRQFRPSLVCVPEVATQLQPDLPADVELIPLRLRKPSQLSAAFQLGRILRERRVDILHSHLFYSSLFASPIGWLGRVPVIIETPHVREHWRQGWFKSHFLVDRLIGRFVHRYIAVSGANARYLVEEKGLPARKVIIIHNGCDVDRFDPNHRPPPDLRRNLGFGHDDPVLVVAGRLEPQKGHRILLDALPAVLRQFPHVRLVCVGSGSLRADLEAQAHELGLTESVRFVGHRPNMPDWFALADFTVLPSFYEGLPLAAIESLAAGRTVVATAVDGTPEVVLNGETGRTVAPADAAALARAICHLLNDPDERQRLGRAGRRWAEDRFSDRVQVARTEDLYREMVLSRRGVGTAAQSHVAATTARAGQPGDR